MAANSQATLRGVFELTQWATPPTHIAQVLHGVWPVECACIGFELGHALHSELGHARLQQLTFFSESDPNFSWETVLAGTTVHRQYTQHPEH